MDRSLAVNCIVGHQVVLWVCTILEQLVLGRNYNAVYVNVVAYVSWSCGKSVPPSASVFNNSNCCVLRKSEVVK